MDRIYMNRIEGQRRIHIEIHDHEISDLLDDLKADPEPFAATHVFLDVLRVAEETFSPVVAEGRRDRAARTAARQTTGQDDTCTEDARRPRCHPRHTDDCPYTDPAVGQPAFEYPRQDGDLTVLGPEAFASSDGQVISWRGLNYVPQVDNQPLAEARRDIHEALVVLPAPEADRVRALVARLETAAHAAVGQPAEAHDTDRAAILREAIEAVLGRVEAYEGMGQDAVDRNRERTAIVSMLRRMAVEGER